MKHLVWSVIMSNITVITINNSGNEWGNEWGCFLHVFLVSSIWAKTIPSILVSGRYNEKNNLCWRHHFPVTCRKSFAMRPTLQLYYRGQWVERIKRRHLGRRHWVKTRFKAICTIQNVHLASSSFTLFCNISSHVKGDHSYEKCNYKMKFECRISYMSLTLR